MEFMELASSRFAAHALPTNAHVFNRPSWPWPHEAGQRSFADDGPDGKTVFLVDKFPGPGSPIKAALEQRGYTVIHAGSVSEALRLWSRLSARVDLFLADISLGRDHSVEELVRLLQAENSRLRVLFANDLEQPAETLLGPQGYPQQLVRIVDNCLA
jgi:CheY-like chemotaxis protein